MGWAAGPPDRGGRSWHVPLGLAPCPAQEATSPVRLVPGGTGVGPESHFRVFSVAASTMDTSWALPLFLLFGKSPAQLLLRQSPSQQPPTPSPPLLCSPRSRGPQSLFCSSANRFHLWLRKPFPGPGFECSLHQIPPLEISGSVSGFKSHC